MFPSTHARLAWFERLSTEQVAQSLRGALPTSSKFANSSYIRCFCFASPNELPRPHRALSPAVVSGAGGGTPAAGAGTAITAGVLVAGVLGFFSAPPKFGPFQCFCYRGAGS